ncbi:C4-dicarboxylate ABC transporter [Nitrosomonas sp. Nm166]|uniref:C4-dicarboxylate ABC transporter n=1 Tax=Nitrosomonas sp. Nm166 TaxID=1881054 RepID=UPI0008E6978A|nr:C4-dicarboxylate ABC transporter [Nitrosomonas sp. Nm166]SFD87325.1 hypothetical protein SAMN05428977_1001138 [Nitrosomonas sp. Nm166]
MQAVQVFIISAVIIAGAFFGVLSFFDLPQSTSDWIVSDIVLGIILYLSYLVLAASGSSKTKTRYFLKKSTV